MKAREIPPIMVVSEETDDSVTFQFRGKRWAVATFILGITLCAIFIYLYVVGKPASQLILAVVGLFAVISLYSSAYSWTSVQWLTANGRNRTIRFHKENFYGLVDWEKPGSEFKNIKVWHFFRASNWSITLIDRDGYELYLGENEFGAFSHDNACAIADMVTRRTGIPIDDSKVSYIPA